MDTEAVREKIRRGVFGEYLREQMDYIWRQRDLNSILRTIDFDRFNDIRHRYKDASPYPGWSKFLDIKKWMGRKLKTAYSLNLHRSGPLRILDIGSGPGYFAYVCQHLGHGVMATDVGDNPLYNELIELLDIERIVCTIKPMEPLPHYGTRFDLVTAQKACFHIVDGEKDWEIGQCHNYLAELTRCPEGRVWGVPEWRFFLKDLAENHMSPEGRVCLNLNTDLEGKIFSEELLEFFRSHGASVDHKNVHFESMSAFLD